MTAYATAFYINQRILHSPHYWTKLLFSMAVLTAAALAIIRVSYFETLGRPDPTPTLTAPVAITSSISSAWPYTSPDPPKSTNFFVEASNRERLRPY